MRCRHPWLRQQNGLREFCGGSVGGLLLPYTLFPFLLPPSSLYLCVKRTTHHFLPPTFFFSIRLLSTLVATRPFPLLSLFKFEIDDVLLGEMLACINERMTLCSSALVGLSALDTAREPEGAAFPLEAAVAHAAEGASREKAFGGARDGCSAPPINNEVELRPFLPSCPSCINVTFSSLGNDLQSLILLLQAFPSCGRFRLSTCLLTKSERANASAFAARCLALQTALVETHGRVSPSYALSLPSLSAAFDSWEAAFK